MKKRLCILFFILLFYTCGSLAMGSNLVFLGNIEFSHIEGNSDSDFELRLFIKEKGALFEHLTKDRGYKIIKESEYLAIINRQYSFPHKREYSNIEPSFVIDFNVEAFKQIREEIVKEYGEKPDPENLINYVNNYIKDKNFNRGFDIASVIAEKREGDCTEHAVLLVSIMRMFKIPARLVIGVKVLNGKENGLAYGHAWVEYILNGKWNGADPSLLDKVDHSYIPLGTLDREGMDYSMGMITLFNRLPYRIEGSGL